MSVHGADGKWLWERALKEQHRLGGRHFRLLQEVAERDRQESEAWWENKAAEYMRTVGCA
jgi:hypothetical protein